MAPRIGSILEVHRFWLPLKPCSPRAVDAADGMRRAARLHYGYTQPSSHLPHLLGADPQLARGVTRGRTARHQDIRRTARDDRISACLEPGRSPEAHRRIANLLQTLTR